ncbi:MAG TPA: 16S rRNA (guanine(527)-N(7))-methyltransferase RsmG [Rhizomicrobium sp.]|nr:16S rRNA (guanine(527)-N(7))-methyltransferase RsmG [Rhizomicrobium sp.]
MAAFGPEAFAEKVRVSRETLDRLKIHVDLLRDWSARHNLVSQRSLDDVWRRHVWDSAQLTAFVPRNATKIADLGSGAGFPGLVLAALLRERVSVTLYEATRKKADFLQVAAKAMDLEVEIRNVRIEDVPNRPFDVVVARALAPLGGLLDYSQRFCTPRTVCLFLKGQSVAAELTEARKSWRMKVSQHQSMTHPSGVILEIRELGHVGARARSKKR